MEWKKGYSASYYARIIDPVAWRETERIEITGGSINRGEDGLRDAADIDTTKYDVGEQYIRIYLDAKQSGTSQHVPLFTGLTSKPKRKIEGDMETVTLQCYSMLKPASDVLLDRGYYAPSGILGTTIIQDLLKVVPAPVEVIEDKEKAPMLRTSIIAESGETRLTMTDKILNAIDWMLRIKGDGTLQLMPKPEEADISFDPLENDVIEPSIDIDYDWYAAPNVFRATEDDMSAIAKDESPDSPLSTVSRGREIWAEETSCNLNAGETIAEYAVRRLKEMQSKSITASYDRRYHPDVYVGSLVRLHYPRQGLDGVFEVTSQKIKLGHGANTNEEVVKK